MPSSGRRIINAESVPLYLRKPSSCQSLGSETKEQDEDGGAPHVQIRLNLNPVLREPLAFELLVHLPAELSQASIESTLSTRMSPRFRARFLPFKDPGRFECSVSGRRMDQKVGEGRTAPQEPFHRPRGQRKSVK